MSTSLKILQNNYHSACVKLTLLAHEHSNVLVAGCGLCLLTVGMNDLASAQVEYIGDRAYEVADNSDGQSNFYKLLSGSFGSLIMVVAGLGAMVSAAMGAYKAAVAMLVVAISAFCIRATVNASLGYDDIRLQNATQ